MAIGVNIGQGPKERSRAEPRVPTPTARANLPLSARLFGSGKPCYVCPLTFLFRSTPPRVQASWTHGCGAGAHVSAVLDTGAHVLDDDGQTL